MPRHFPDGLSACIPTTYARLQRRLPAPGELSVRVGSRVEPDDLIGRCSVQPDPVLLHVAVELGVEPADIQRLMRRKVGTRVAIRDVIARRGHHQVLAPVRGVVTEIDLTTGFVVLTPDPVPASLTAMLRGYITEVEEGRAATIETPAAIVQGAVGFGDQQWGMLRVLVERPDQPIVPSLIDTLSAFTILLGGSITLEALRAAAKQQVLAVVVGSVDIDVLRAFWGERWTTNWERLQKPSALTKQWDDGPAVILTEGFGNHAMNDRIFDVLARFAGREVYVDAATCLGAPQRRPRVIAPLSYNDGKVEEAIPVRDLQPGVTVRLLNTSHLGATARLEHIAPLGRLGSGIRTATATVVLSDGQQVTVPLTALDVLG